MCPIRLSSPTAIAAMAATVGVIAVGCAAASLNGDVAEVDGDTLTSAEIVVLVDAAFRALDSYSYVARSETTSTNPFNGVTNTYKQQETVSARRGALRRTFELIDGGSREVVRTVIETNGRVFINRLGEWTEVSHTIELNVTPVPSEESVLPPAQRLRLRDLDYTWKSEVRAGEIDGRSVLIVSGTKDDTPPGGSLRTSTQTLYVDAETFLPARIEFLVKSTSTVEGTRPGPHQIASIVREYSGYNEPVEIEVPEPFR